MAETTVRRDTCHLKTVRCTKLKKCSYCYFMAESVTGKKHIF